MLWYKADGLGGPMADVLEEMGCQVRRFLPGEKIPADSEIVFTHGPFGSIVPLAKQILAMPEKSRPAFIFWQSEQFPDPRLPTWVWKALGEARSAIERLSYIPDSDGHQQRRFRIAEHLFIGHRFRYYGDILWLQRQKLSFLFAVMSTFTGELLRKRGINALIAHKGSYPGCGEDLRLVRDIPVLWFGKPGTRRRKILVQKLRSDLAKRSIPLLVVDGLERPYVFGAERTELLNRTKIVVNILREPWDDNTERFFIASPNRSMFLSEPILPHVPITPDVHYIEVPFENMAERIEYYLQHEEERQQIADNAFRLVTTELNIRKGLEKILDAYYRQIGVSL